MRNNRAWQATVTPLASIIGSGFLVVAPLLADVTGQEPVLAMLVIVGVAYLIGGAIRFNILYSEPLEESGTGPASLKTLARISHLALTVAYVISVAFYIRLLSSFALSMTPFKAGLYGDLLATAILAAIAMTGWTRGLQGLQFIEEISVSVKLAIIVALLISLAIHNYDTGVWTGQPHSTSADWITRLRMLAGMLLVVQGFETSRYIGSEYSPNLRRWSMAAAQIASAIIYVVFVAFITPVLAYLPPGKPDETAIIGLSSHVAMVLPFMLIVAAFMSQLSAAIADTLGAGGLVSEETAKRIPERSAYPALIAFSIALIWLFNIFEVIAIASRAFAFYYLMQVLIALVVAGHVLKGRQRLARQLWYALLAVLLALIVVFALPVE